MMRKLFALLLAIAMLSALLSACSGNNETPSGTPDSGQSSPSPSQAAPEPSEPGEPDETVSASVFPLDEPATFTAWFPDSPPVYNYVDDWVESQITFDAVARKTNVHFDWTLSMEPMVQLAIIAASGEWPDVFFEADRYYTGGLEKMYEDGILQPLTQLVEEYVPNYYQAVNADDELRRQCITSTGDYLALYCIFTEPNDPQGSMLVREDWLTEWGMTADDITTYDKYHDYLVRAKQEKNATLYLRSTMVSTNLGAGFGVAIENSPERGTYAIYFKNGEAKFGPLEPEYREYLAYMNGLYNEGLIHDKSISWTNQMNPDKALVYNNEVSMVPFQFTTIGEFITMSDDDNFSLIGIASAVKNEGDKVYIGSNEIRRSNSTALSTTCSNTELFLQFANWGYTDEGMEAFCYGIEGENFEYDANGNAVFYTDLMTEDMAIMVYGMVYLFPNDGPHFYDTTGYYENYYADYTLESMARAKSVYADELWSRSDAVTILEEDNADYVAIMGDLGTFVTEHVPQVVTGQISLDEWDGLVEQMKSSMRAETAVQYWQNAYDAYMSK